MRIVKLSAALVLAGLGAGVAQADLRTQLPGCAMAYGASPKVHEVMRQGFDLPRYDEICEALQSADAALRIIGEWTVIEGRSIAWVAVDVIDRHRPILADGGGGNMTYVSPVASEERARAMLRELVNDAIGSLDIKADLGILEQARKEALSDR